MTDQADTKAFFSKSIEENMDSLYGVALRLTGSQADAEDLVADSVSKAWTAIDTLDDRTRFRPWVFRILHNRFISDYRKKSIRPVESPYEELSVDDGDGEVASLLMNESVDFLSWWASPEQEFFSNILGEEILAAMDKLPESFQVTITLVNVEGLTYDEAAVALGVPKGTVRSRMKRGRTLLQKALWLQAQEAGLKAGKTSG
jgi:RNA polymerase sigma-70 factor (ECF subfamily)